MSVQPTNPLIPNSLYTIKFDGNTVVIFVDESGGINRGFINSEDYDGSDVVDFLYYSLDVDPDAIQNGTGVISTESGDTIPLWPDNKLALSVWIAYLGSPRPKTYSYSEKKLDPRLEALDRNRYARVQYERCYQMWVQYLMATGLDSDSASAKAKEICDHVFVGSGSWERPPKITPSKTGTTITGGYGSTSSGARLGRVSNGSPKNVIASTVPTRANSKLNTAPRITVSSGLNEGKLSQSLPRNILSRVTPLSMVNSVTPLSVVNSVTLSAPILTHVSKTPISRISRDRNMGQLPLDLVGHSRDELQEINRITHPSVSQNRFLG